MNTKSPDMPSPQQTADAQLKSNLATAQGQAQINRVNQNNPYGSISYQRNAGYDDNAFNQAMQKYQKDLSSYNSKKAPSIGAVPSKFSRGSVSTKAPVLPTREQFRDANQDTWTQNTTLSPEQQQIFDQSQQGQIGQNSIALTMLKTLQDSGAYNKPLDASGIPDFKYSVFDKNDPFGQNNEYVKQAQDAAYNIQTRYLDPLVRNQEDQLNTRLVNQGLQPGTEAYNRAYNLFQTDRNRSYADARDKATISGNDMANQMFSRSLQDANLNNSTAQQEFNRRVALRASPLNELTGLLKGAMVPTYSASPQSSFASAGSFNDQLAADKNYFNYQGMQSGNNQAIGSAIGGAGAMAFGLPPQAGMAAGGLIGGMF